MTSLQFIGGGNMAKALLGGLLSANWANPTEIVVVARRPESRAEIEAMFSGVSAVEKPVKQIDSVLAVKPVDVSGALAGLGGLEIPRLMSVVSGVRSATLQAGIDSECRVIRAMPNTPSQIGFGAAAISSGKTATDADMDWAESILSSVGVVVRVKEEMLDAITGLSGSGVGFAFYFAEALQTAGRELGLEAKSVDALVAQTLLGAANMLLKGELSAKELREQVTSPNGTTEAGLKALDEGQFFSLVEKAVTKATERSVEIANEFQEQEDKK